MNEILPLEDVLHRLDCFINQNDVGTIFPENFFTSIRYYLTPEQPGESVEVTKGYENGVNGNDN